MPFDRGVPRSPVVVGCPGTADRGRRPTRTDWLCGLSAHTYRLFGPFPDTTPTGNVRRSKTQRPSDRGGGCRGEGRFPPTGPLRRPAAVEGSGIMRGAGQGTPDRGGRCRGLGLSPIAHATTTCTSPWARPAGAPCAPPMCSRPRHRGCAGPRSRRRTWCANAGVPRRSAQQTPRDDDPGTHSGAG